MACKLEKGTATQQKVVQRTGGPRPLRGQTRQSGPRVAALELDERSIVRLTRPFVAETSDELPAPAFALRLWVIPEVLPAASLVRLGIRQPNLGRSMNESWPGT